MKYIEAMELALEALKKTQSEGYNLPGTAIEEAITAIKQALATPVQEPVGYFYFDEGQWKQASDPISFAGCTKLYNYAPTAQRQWVGLTDEDRVDLWKATETDNRMVLIDAIEVKLREKNTAAQPAVPHGWWIVQSTPEGLKMWPTSENKLMEVTAQPSPVPLTDEQIHSLWRNHPNRTNIVAVVRAIETAHGITKGQS